MSAEVLAAETQSLHIAGGDHPEASAALRRNERYLREFIEELSICPYARMCREQQRLYRAVSLQAQPTPQSVAEHVLSLEPLRQFEIGLLIFPNFTPHVSPHQLGTNTVGESHQFERFVAEARNHYGKLRKGVPGFFLVAFHPAMPMNLANPDVAVRFMRRSPDPTIQLVRPEVIDSVRNPHHNRDELSATIAEVGLQAVSSIGPDQIAQRLADIHRDERSTKKN